MKHKLGLVFVLAASLMDYGQGRGRGGGMGESGSMGQGQGMGQMGQGRGMGTGQMDHGASPTGKTEHGTASTQTQKPLNDAQINGGAFRMLEKKTGMTSDQLKALY